LTFTSFFNVSAMQSLAWVSVLSYFFRQNPRHIVFEDSLRLALTLSRSLRLRAAVGLPSFCFSTLLCKTFFFLLFVLSFLFHMQFSRCSALCKSGKSRSTLTAIDRLRALSSLS